MKWVNNDARSNYQSHLDTMDAYTQSGLVYWLESALSAAGAIVQSNFAY